MSAHHEPSTLREALFDELDAPGSITKSRIRNLLIRYPETGPRTITTVEELDALPSGSVILDSAGEPNVLHDNGWVLPGGGGGYTTWAVAQALPATVLHEPAP